MKRVEEHLEPLRAAIGLRDAKGINTALQVQLMILRYCANTQLTYFLRTMPPSVTIDAALHPWLEGSPLLSLPCSVLEGPPSPPVLEPAAPLLFVVSSGQTQRLSTGEQ